MFALKDSNHKINGLCWGFLKQSINHTTLSDLLGGTLVFMYVQVYTGDSTLVILLNQGLYLLIMPVGLD